MENEITTTEAPQDAVPAEAETPLPESVVPPISIIQDVENVGDAVEKLAEDIYNEVKAEI